jgi:sortase A
MKRIKKHVVRLKELRVINNILTLVAITLGLYIIFAPLLPQAKWVIVENTPLKEVLGAAEAVEKSADGVIGSNRLFIPKLGLEEVIYEGGTEQLRKGVLRRGHTSTPDKGSNTVLVGHRFLYDVRGVFYHLDKLKVGDTISVHWEIDKYDYRVSDISIVTPETVSVEDPTSVEVLTLYTCTPLWNPKDRLVVRAVRI